MPELTTEATEEEKHMKLTVTPSVAAYAVEG